MKTPRAARGWTPLRVAALMAALVLWNCGENGDPPTDPGGGGEENQAPVASAGADVTVSAGLPVTLDASASTDPDGDALSVSWSLAVPSGSAATLDDDASLTPSFTPDLAGEYVATATVSDGTDTDDASVTVTAEDNTASAMVDETGGEIVSADGEVRMVIPAGAVDSETEIRITRVGEGQVPEAIAALGLAGLTVYDLQPTGLTFAVPLEVSVEAADAVTETAGEVTVEPAYLFAESEGVLESLEDLETVVSGADPTVAITTGGLGHFSSLARLQHMGIRHELTAPASAEVGVPFTVTVGAGVSADENRPFETLTSLAVLHGRASERVDTLPGFQEEAEFGVYQVVFIENEYVCTEAGPGKVVVAALPFVEEGQGDRPLIGGDVYLEAPIECTEPVDLDIVQVAANQVFNVFPGREGDEALVGGHTPVAWASGSEDQMPLSGAFDGDPATHLAVVGPLATLVGVSLIGRLYEYLLAWNRIPTSFNDQMGQLVRGDDGKGYGASGIRQPRVVEADPETGSLSTLTYLIENIEAVWGNGETVVGVQVEGDGSPSANNAVPVLLNLALLTAVVTNGDALGTVLDEWQRTVKDLDCTGLLGSALACVLTAGENLVGVLLEGQEERAGHQEVFLLDPEAGTATTLEEGDSPAVGGTAYEYMGRSFLAWADQEAETVEVREVSGTGEIAWSWTQPVGEWCSRIKSFTVTPDGTRAVAACLGEEGGNGPNYLSLAIAYDF